MMTPMTVIYDPTKPERNRPAPLPDAEASTRLAALQTVNPERVSFQVPERYAAELRRNQTIAFQVAAMRNKTFTGTVDFVDPVVQLPGRTITIKALVPNPKRELQPGMFVDVRLATSQRPQAIVVPEEAVLALQAIADPEDRQIVEKTFQQVPAP